MTNHVERRGDERYDVPGRVRIKRPGTHVTSSGWLAGLSLNGCLIDLDTVGDIPHEALVELHFQSGYHVFSALGMVMHLRTWRKQMGVGFLIFGKSGHADLQELILELEAARKDESLCTLPVM